MRKKFFTLFFMLLVSFVALGEMGQKNMRLIIFDQPTNFRGMQLSDVLMVLTEDTGINFIPDDSVKGKVINNNFVGGESLDEVLDIITTTNGLKITELGSNIYMVDQKSTASKGGVALVGTVRVKNYDVGIDGAKVTVLNSGVQPVTTSYNGKFIMNNLFPGTYIMRVEKPGYETEGEFITIGNGEKNINVDLYRSGEKISVNETEASKAKIIGSHIAGGKNTITEQINLLNISAEDAVSVLVPLMETQASTSTKEQATATTTNPGMDTTTQNKVSADINTVKLSDNFKVIPVPKLNMLLVSGTPDQVRIARNVINELDRKSKQVRIAAQVIDITDNLFENLGFSWAYSRGSLKPGQVNNDTYPGDDNAVTVPGQNGTGTSNLNPIQLGLGLINPFNLQLLRYFNSKNDFLDFSVNMLQGTQDAVISAIPSILVVNGETGTFKVTDESVISYSSSTVQGGTVNYTANLGEAGVVMNVTPIIKDDDSIQLKIRVEVSKFLGAITAPGANDLTSYANPKSMRVIETIVNIHDGDTIFIGGMKSADIKNLNDKVPLLGDVPVIGEAFKNKSVSKQINDLYIKLKIDIANSHNVKEKPNNNGFMMVELLEEGDIRAGAQLKKNIYPQFN